MGRFEPPVPSPLPAGPLLQVVHRPVLLHLRMSRRQRECSAHFNRGAGGVNVAGASSNVTFQSRSDEPVLGSAPFGFQCGMSVDLAIGF
jgi:hypothetical protein